MAKTGTTSKMVMLASAAALAMGCALAGCAGNSTVPRNASGASAATSTSGEDGTPAALGEPKDPLDSKEVWLPVSETRYEYDPEGNLSSTDSRTYEYDEHGNATTVTILSGLGSPLERTDVISYGAYDESGYPLSMTDGKGRTSEYDIELDERGRAVSVTDGNGSMSPDHVLYAYWDSGAVRTERISKDIGAMMEYDERGYLVQAAGGAVSASYTWTFSKDGLPVKCVERKVSPAKDAVPVDDVEYSLECDEHGNIVKVLKDGQVVCERTYIEIESPSINAKLTGYEKSIL